MDLRDILAGALAVAPDAARTAVSAQVAEADRRFLAGTLPTASPLWGEEIAAEEGHDAARQPWFFRRPKRMGPDLAAELEDAGLAPDARVFCRREGPAARRSAPPVPHSCGNRSPRRRGARRAPGSTRVRFDSSSLAAALPVSATRGQAWDHARRVRDFEYWINEKCRARRSRGPIRVAIVPGTRDAVTGSVASDRAAVPCVRVASPTRRDRGAGQWSIQRYWRATPTVWKSPPNRVVSPLATASLADRPGASRADSVRP